VRENPEWSLQNSRCGLACRLRRSIDWTQKGLANLPPRFNGEVSKEKVLNEDRKPCAPIETVHISAPGLSRKKSRLESMIVQHAIGTTQRDCGSDGLSNI